MALTWHLLYLLIATVLLQLWHVTSNFPSQSIYLWIGWSDTEWSPMQCLPRGNLPRRYWVHWQEVHWIFHIFLGGKFIPYGMLNLKSLISVFGLYIFKLHNEPCCVGIAGAVGWISHHKWAQLDASGCEHTMLSWMIWVEICKDAGRQCLLPFVYPSKNTPANIDVECQNDDLQKFGSSSSSDEILGM